MAYLTMLLFVVGDILGTGVYALTVKPANRAPTITAATAGCSSTQRVATLAIDTPCFAAIACAART